MLGWLLLGGWALCHWLTCCRLPIMSAAVTLAAPATVPTAPACHMAHRENDESLRLGGFNMATHFLPGVPLCDLVGTLDYLAPEVFSSNYSCQVGAGCMQLHTQLPVVPADGAGAGAGAGGCFHVSMQMQLLGYHPSSHAASAPSSTAAHSLMIPYWPLPHTGGHLELRHHPVHHPVRQASLWQRR
jgi:hypothetical protein